MKRWTTRLHSRAGFVPVLTLVFMIGGPVRVAEAHSGTVPQHEAEKLRVDGSAAPAVRDATQAVHATLHLTVRDDRLGRPAPALVRVTRLGGSDATVRLAGWFERPAGWFSGPGEAQLALAPGRYRIEATRGTDSAIAQQEVVLAGHGREVLTLTPRRFYDVQERGLQSVKTHLHLLVRQIRKMGVDLADRAEVDDYLRTVGASDGLDLVYVTYLTQPGGGVLSNDYTDDDLAGLSNPATLFSGGQEHRHGGRRIKVTPSPPSPRAEGKPVYQSDDSKVSMSYGHVLLLGIPGRSLPASIGPGLADYPQATDGTPLRAGMAFARARGGGAIWCHGSSGLEQVPDWVGGMLQAQNIYDGGNEGTFDTVYYPLLNAGLKVPFSTGTDWGIWDFSRVYVATKEPVSSAAFLRELAAGRTFITNEPFLEFGVGDARAGNTIPLAGPGVLPVRGRAVGRSDFVRLQLVVNGRVVRESAARREGDHFVAEIDGVVEVHEPGWMALRIPPAQPYMIRADYSGEGVSLLGKPVFAHTSPVYVTIGGRGVRDAAAVQDLISRVEAALATIDEHGVFANGTEREELRGLYTGARDRLRAMLRE